MAKREMSEQARAAKMIRAHLKKHGIKASVTSDSASMMTAVRVELTNCLPGLKAEIESYCKAFQYGHFDGMIDCYEYSNTRDDIPQAKFVTVSNRWDDEHKRACWDWLKANHDPAHEDQLSDNTFEERTIDDGTILHRAMCDTRGEYGWVTTQKPRVLAEAGK